jgi:2-(1,2-epoxy-1,2-dihydrophenyl)acetyl-CoA isomerase
MTTNRMIDAEEALRIGLIDRVVDDDALAEATRALATQIAETPSRAGGVVKQLVQAHELAELEAHLAREAAAIAQIAAQPESQAALAAFLRKK